MADLLLLSSETSVFEQRDIVLLFPSQAKSLVPSSSITAHLQNHPALSLQGATAPPAHLSEAGNNRDGANYHLKKTHESLLKAAGYLKAAKDKLQKVDKNLEEVNKLVNNVLSTGDERMDSIKYYKRAYDISEENGRKMGEALRVRDEEVRRQAEEVERLRKALEIGREHGNL